jgi:hypothetical protein
VLWKVYHKNGHKFRCTGRFIIKTGHKFRYAGRFIIKTGHKCRCSGRFIIKNFSNILGQVVSTINTHFVFIRIVLSIKK